MRARKRRMGGRVPWVWCFWKRGRAGCSRVDGSGWQWPPRTIRVELGPTAWFSYRGVCHRSRARESPEREPAHELWFGGAAPGGGLPARSPRRCNSTPAVAVCAGSLGSAPACARVFVSSFMRTCSAAAPSCNARRRGTWVGGADGRAARARGFFFAAVPLRWLLRDFPASGSSGCGANACDAAHVRACRPPHRPAPQYLF